MKNQNKINYSKVSFIREEKTEFGLTPIYGFITYAWSFPKDFADGKIKSGYHYNVKDNGETRMKQACSASKTAISQEPMNLKEGLQVWEVPVSLCLDLSKAEKFAKEFDALCNKALSKYKVGGKNAKMIGEEWYRISVADMKYIRNQVYYKLCDQYNAKVEVKKAQPMKPRGLQADAVLRIIEKFLKDKINRSKGIAPTGFGKTVTIFLAIIEGIAQKLFPNRLIIVTAPTQFLANKNADCLNEYAHKNGVSNLINIPIYSGSDLGFSNSSIRKMERKSILADVIKGYLRNPKNTIVLHTCSPSMELLDEVLYSIGQDTVDLAICDEAHTLASTRNNTRNFILNDYRIKITKRFFLTATEKNLVNPNDIREGMVDNFMNNEDVYGDYLFRYSFADGVINKHIVPFVAKIYEYSSKNYQMNQMLNTLKSMKLEQLESLTVNGDEYTEVSPKLAKSIVSIDKTLKEANKVLVICSHNAHVYSLDAVIKALQEQGKYFQDCDITNIVASDYTPAERSQILEDIDQRNNKQIIIVGPWAITGVDCPSIDAVYWNYTPGNQISVTQGTGRGTRIIEGKSHLLVCFNMDIDVNNGEIKDTILNTLVKLYEAQFPSHEVIIKQVRRILGRRFLSVERDTDAQIEPLVRMDLDDIYEAAEGYEFLNMVSSKLVNYDAYTKNTYTINKLVEEFKKENLFNFFGKNICDYDQLVKFLLTNKQISLRTIYDYLNEDNEVVKFGGRRKDAFEIRELAFNGFEVTSSYSEFKKQVVTYLESNSIQYLLPAFGDRTTSIEWGRWCKNFLGEKAYKDKVYNKAIETKKERGSLGKQGEWTEERKRKASQHIINFNKSKTRTGNTVKVQCPDGHVTSAASAKVYCKNRNLDYGMCIKIS